MSNNMFTTDKDKKKKETNAKKIARQLLKDKKKDKR